MRYFAGLDVSLEETAICVVDETGRIMKELRAASEPDPPVAALQRTGLPLERIGLEASSLTAWLYEGLRHAGLPAICIEARQANAAMKTMPNKTDRNDARALAQIMRMGWYREVHVKSRQCQFWRSLLVARRTVLNEMRSIENVVRAILREAGIKLGTPSRTAFADRVRELASADAYSASTAHHCATANPASETTGFLAWGGQPAWLDDADFQKLPADRRGAAASSAIIARLLRSALAGDVAAQPLAARFRPYLGKLVEAFKAACPGRKLEPRQFAAREDMDVGLDRLRVVEGAGPQQHRVARRAVILAPHRGAAIGAAEDLLRPAAACRDHHRAQFCMVGFDKALFDPDVQGKGAAA